MKNGSGKRHLDSWVDAFVDHTANLDSPAIFRRWTAISTIAAALEQKVWLMTSSALFPNLYTLICGHPGVGKTRTIRVGRSYVSKLPDFHLSPISMTFASLVDSLLKAKRMIIRLPDEPLEYNSMFICVDELGAFISKYDNEMIDGLSAFYDVDAYSQTRRTTDIKIKIESPQVNILAGSTPQNLTALLPEKAWGQGFTSRLIMIFSDERIIGDDFAPQTTSHGEDLEHDLGIINSLIGQFHVTAEYQRAVNNWRSLGEPPVPSHPRLLHYVTRRRTHLYKLSMVAAIDKGNALVLGQDEFNRAMGWLLEAEDQMPEIFKAGAANADGSAMEEIAHFIRIADKGTGVTEPQILRFAKDLIPLHSILRVVEIMERSGQIKCMGKDRRTGIRYYQTLKT